MAEVPGLSLKLVTRLLEDGAEFTSEEIFLAVQRNNFGAQIAMVLHASKKGTLEPLLQQGINVDATYPYLPLSSLIQSATALYRAVQQGHITAVEALLKHGANPDLACSENSQTPLGCALVGEMTEVLQLLLPYSKLPSQQLWDIAFNYQRQGDQYNPILVETLLAQPHYDKTEALRHAQQYDPTYIVKIGTPTDASVMLTPPVAPILSSQDMQPSTPAVPPQGLRRVHFHIS